MSKYLGVYFLLTLVCIAAHAAVTGASVTNVQLTDGKATITILNTSQRDITGYSIGITAQLADGRTHYSERTEDYGPAAFTHKALHPGETSTEVISLGPTTQSVHAEVVVAIYGDQTAEVKSLRTFKDTLAQREGIAKAMQLSANAFKAAAADPRPRDRAQIEFDKLIKSADTSKANVEFLKSHARLAATAPVGEERQFLHEHAEQLQQEADLFTRHAQIRRVP